MLTGNNYEIVKSSSTRVKKGEYDNEIILIDTDSYKRFKIEFKTCGSDFSITKTTFNTFNNSNSLPVCREIHCKIEHERFYSVRWWNYLQYN